MSAVYELGPFRLDTEAHVLTRAGVAVGLGARAAAVLHALVASPNEFVGKASIIDAAWPEIVVEESNLAVQISAIRRALSRVPGGERWIETLPKRGYRFVGPVTKVRDRPPKETGQQNRHSNLPESLTSFVGRERELVEIKGLLPGKRLVTLVGIGGIGKTRLALQVAAEVVDAYRDGVWVVRLDAIADPLLVPTTVAQALGVAEKRAVPLSQTLCRHLKSRQLLLVLDNCEHLREGCAKLADAVLREAADTTIMATSREPLRVEGEQIFPVPTLSMPAPTASVDVLSRSEAVQLFIERAQRQLPGFEVTAARAPVLAQLCIHLDGIPLALELAAARMRSLSIEQISARIDDRFRLLTAGGATALRRQETLRATLDWSYDLLSEPERVVLRRLAVFPGSFTLEAASSIAQDRAIDEHAVIDLLAQLVGRSLVVADTNEALAHYSLLETTRAYALEKLAEAGEAGVVRRRHAENFRDKFERARDHHERIISTEWRANYLSELDNVRAALDWAIGPDGDSAIGIALGGSSSFLWTSLSLLNEGRRRLDAVVGQVGEQTPTSDLARLWLARGVLWGTGAPVQAAADLERAISLYRQLDDGMGLSASLLELGRMDVFMSRFEEAAVVLAEAKLLLDRVGPTRKLALYFESFAFLKMLTGDFASARTQFEKALLLYRDAGAETSALGVLLNLSDLAWALDDRDAALDGFREAATLMRKAPRFSEKAMLGVCLTNIAGVHTERGELAQALVAAKEGLPLRKEMDAVSALDHLALRAALAGKVENAARIVGYADFSFEAKRSKRQPNEARARNRLQALLSERLGSDELDRLASEGAKMSEDDACAMALEE